MDGHCFLDNLKLPYLIKYPPTLRKETKSVTLTYLRTENLTSCNELCAECIDKICTRCKPGYYYYEKEHSCVINCPLLLVGNPETGKCEGCPSDCLTCDPKTRECIQCLFDRLLLNGQCIIFTHALIYFLKDRYYLQQQSSKLSDIIDLKVSYKAYEFSCSEIDFVLQNPTQYRLNFNSTRQFCGLQDIPNIMEGDYCHPSCLICKGPNSDNPGECLKCRPELDGATVIKDKGCFCPNGRNYYDHVSGNCVEECGPGRMLIPMTSECVQDCLAVSKFSRVEFIFAYRKSCLENCPDGSYLQVDFPELREIKCIPKRPDSDYQNIISMNLSNPIPQQCLFRTEQCKLQQLSTPAELQTPLNQYFSAFQSSKFLTIIDRPEEHNLFHHYMSSINIKAVEDINKTINLLQYFGYACKSKFHLYHFLGSLDAFLDKIALSPEIINQLPSLFDSVLDCFEGLHNNGETDFPSHYQGQHLSCIPDQPVRSQERDTRSFMRTTENVTLVYRVETFSTLKMPYMVLQCNFKGLTRKNQPIDFHIFGIISKHSKYSETDWWISNIKIAFHGIKGSIEIYSWQHENSSWYKETRTKLNLDFDFAQFNNTVYLMSFVNDVYPWQSQDKKDSGFENLVYVVSIGALVVIIIICLIANFVKMLKRSVDQEVKPRRFKLEETNSDIELHMSGQMDKEKFEEEKQIDEEFEDK